jgi:hypothetical protein
MTLDRYQGTIAPWRQFAMASIIEAANGDHAAVIALPMLQE